MAIFSGFYLSHLFCQCLWHMRFSGSPAVYPEVYFTLSTPYSCTLIYQLVFWRVLWNHLSVVPFCQQVRQLTFSMGSAPLSLPSARVALCLFSGLQPPVTARPWEKKKARLLSRHTWLGSKKTTKQEESSPSSTETGFFRLWFRVVALSLSCFKFAVEPWQALKSSSTLELHSSHPIPCPHHQQRTHSFTSALHNGRGQKHLWHYYWTKCILV